MKPMMMLLAAAWAVSSLQAAPPPGQRPPGRDERFTAPENNDLVPPPGKSKIEIKEKKDRRIIDANGIPDHLVGKFPCPGNPNRIGPQNYHFEVTLEPEDMDPPMQLEPYIFGVAVNGVVFDPGTNEFWNDDRASGWHYEAIQGKRRTLGIDRNNAHVQPNGAYHYHGIPTGLADKLGGGGRMILLGWAADGFPIYSSYGYAEPENPESGIVELTSSYRLKSGERPDGKKGPGGTYDGTFTQDYEYVGGSGLLDECNGRFGVTPEYPKGIYYYVVTKDFPYVPRLFRGVPDKSFRHAGPPPGEQGGGPPMPPPPGQPPGGPRS
jgi:hypothetical protein